MQCHYNVNVSSCVCIIWQTHRWSCVTPPASGTALCCHVSVLWTQTLVRPSPGVWTAVTCPTATTSHIHIPTSYWRRLSEGCLTPGRSWNVTPSTLWATTPGSCLSLRTVNRNHLIFHINIYFWIDRHDVLILILMLRDRWCVMDSDTVSSIGCVSSPVSSDVLLLFQDKQTVSFFFSCFDC